MGHSASLTYTSPKLDLGKGQPRSQPSPCTLHWAAGYQRKRDSFGTGELLKPAVRASSRLNTHCHPSGKPYRWSSTLHKVTLWYLCFSLAVAKQQEPSLSCRAPNTGHQGLLPPKALLQKFTYEVLLLAPASEHTKPTPNQEATKVT